MTSISGTGEGKKMNDDQWLCDELKKCEVALGKLLSLATGCDDTGYDAAHRRAIDGGDRAYFARYYSARESAEQWMQAHGVYDLYAQASSLAASENMAARIGGATRTPRAHEIAGNALIAREKIERAKRLQIISEVDRVVDASPV